MSSITAEQLQTKYGAELAQQSGGARALKNYLTGKYPRLNVSDQALKTWMAKYRLPEGAVRVDSAKELEEKYGDKIRHIPRLRPTCRPQKYRKIKISTKSK